MTCIFCEIINKNIPSTPIFEDDYCYACHDINPVAPTHILLFPKQHIQSINDLPTLDSQAQLSLLNAISQITKQVNIDTGFRTVVNTGKDGGQEINHLHFHLIGGRPLTWPPG